MTGPKILNAPPGMARWACGHSVRAAVSWHKRSVRVCRKVRDHWRLKLGSLEIGHRYEHDRYEYLLRRPRWELIQYPELSKWYWSPVPESRVTHPHRNNKYLKLLRRGK